MCISDPAGMSNVQVIFATSTSDTTTSIKVVDATCVGGRVAIGGGGAILGPVDNEDIGIDVTGPFGADLALGTGNAGWRAQATNFFVDSAVAWSVRVFAICAVVQ